MQRIEQLETPMPVTLVAASTEADRRRAFDQFTQSRLEREYRLAAIILRDASEAEDAVHDAAIQTWLHWPDLRDQDRLDAWFGRVLVNEC
jgi:DNA-directed RNA polymerase specialized sigma24 family protein